MPVIAPVAAPAAVARIRLVLLGNPNTGKTTLFNALCGIRAKTSNYPGTTTAIRVGTSAPSSGAAFDVLDLPGVYDLNGDAAECRIAADLVKGHAAGADVFVVVVDASNLSRNLMLAGAVLAERDAVVVALNMMDMARAHRIQIDVGALARRLGCPVVPIVARKNEGLDALRRAVSQRARAASERPVALPARGASLDALAHWADDVTTQTSTHPSFAGVSITDRIDRYVTHRVYGPLSFLAVMSSLFFALFTLAAIPMSLIEALFGRFGAYLTAVLPAGPVRELIVNGVVGGLSGTVVFLPQICLLFFLISLLEDTGYLARAAFIVDRVLSPFGLPGHAFVPLLTAHACAVPGIMSARLIPNRRDRLATILVAPFMSCSARLPVYVLLTSLLFRNPAYAALAFAGCYIIGASAGLLTAAAFSRTTLKGRALPMILELPPYRIPSLRNAVLTAKDQGLSFLRSAGSIIIAICIVMWWLSAYPRAETPAQTQQAASYAGQIGHVIQPAFAPLGFDWQLTVGVVTSFAAREVFVSTMSVLEGSGDGSDVDAGVVERIRHMKRDDGTAVFTPSVAAAALIFFVLAMQCLPTLAVTRKETGSWKYAAIQFGYMSSLAYLAAFAMRTALLMLGVA